MSVPHELQHNFTISTWVRLAANESSSPPPRGRHCGTLLSYRELKRYKNLFQVFYCVCL